MESDNSENSWEGTVTEKSEASPSFPNSELSHRQSLNSLAHIELEDHLSLGANSVSSHRLEDAT